MASLSGSTEILSGGSEAVARSVRGILDRLPPLLMSTTIIVRAKSEGYYAATATIEWSAVTETQTSSGEQQTT